MLMEWLNEGNPENLRYTKPMPNLRHIVMFTLCDGADKERVIAELKRLGEDNPDILEWRIEESLDMRKGTIILENGLFTDQAAKERFRLSDKHLEIGEFMSKWADWKTADYLE